MKFARDRRKWLQWLFEARKRYGLSVLNCAVTSNHIHLVVKDNDNSDVIPKAGFARNPNCRLIWGHGGGHSSSLPCLQRQAAPRNIPPP